MIESSAAVDRALTSVSRACAQCSSADSRARRSGVSSVPAAGERIASPPQSAHRSELAPRAVLMARASYLWFATAMDARAVLAIFDEQIRRHPTAAPGERVERDQAVVRLLAGEGGRSTVTWSQLDETTADAVITATIERFALLGMGEWEWKHYSYDRPADLARRLLTAGFTPEPAEALMVAEIVEPALEVPPPAGVELRRVTDQHGVDALVRVHDRVYGEDHSAFGRQLLARLGRHPSTVAAVVAVAGGTPICAGRVELHPGTEFASLWGGGTLPGWRGRGVFRSLVAYRAALAADRGLRYLQVDASPESRSILQRLGFVELATTTPFIWPAASA